MYKFEPHLLVPCLSQQNLLAYDDFQSAENKNENQIQSEFINLVSDSIQA
jgi:hypothetical protein